MTTTTTVAGAVNKTHRQLMLDNLLEADFWHGKWAHSAFSKKARLRHREFQQAIWWAIQNLENNAD